MPGKPLPKPRTPRHMPRMTTPTFRRRALIAGLGLLALAPPHARAQAVALSDQDRADLARIQTYLDGLRTLKARFLQVAPDGGQTQGTAWLDRPGRMRFEYDPPADYLLVAGNGILTFYDAGLKQTSNIPLNTTPLGILLAEHVALSGAVTVTGITRYPGQIQLSLVRTASPGDGTLTLFFNADPIQLRGWTVVDAQRRDTRIDLANVQLGGRFDPSLFVFVDPNFYQPQRSGGGGG